MGDLLGVKLDGYKTPYKWQKDLKDVAEQYINEPKGWFVLLGQSGCGKTHLCSAVANAMLDRHKEVKYVIWNELVKDIKRDINESQDNSIIENLSEVEVLYIDDLFKGKPTEADKKYCFEILNARYNQKLITIISSELSIDDLMDIDVAVAGRIKQMAASYLKQIGKDERKNYRLHLDEVV